MNQRLLGQRLGTPPLRGWMWGGYLLALAVTAIIARMMVTGFFFLMRV
jgi:hypothetical protein